MGRIEIKNNKTWRFGIGIAFAFTMGFLIYFSLPTEAISGCAGDCMTCHPKLINDPDHAALSSCVKCHNPVNEKFSILQFNNTGCGDRCFTCHAEWPKDGYHAVLDTCLKCHDK